MPGPPVRPIVTSDSPSFDSQMKVKGTFVTGPKRFMTSKFLFSSPEEEAEFVKRNPQFAEFLPLTDVGKPRGRILPMKTKDQVKDGAMSPGGEIKPGSKLQKPKIQKVS